MTPEDALKFLGFLALVEELDEEEEEIPAITSLKDRIRADAKLLTGDEMREQGMID